MSEQSPTPWEVSGSAFWRIYDAAGAEVVNAEGVVSEDLSNRIAHCVNCHAEMVEALKAIDDWWTESFPQGPFAEDLSMWGGIGQLSGETVAIWQKIRFALAKATQTTGGE